jgi:ribosomal protein L29
MGIRYLAEALYRWTRTVEDLEKALAALPADTSVEERARRETELRQARHELARVRAVLDSKKEPPKI